MAITAIIALLCDKNVNEMVAIWTNWTQNLISRRVPSKTKKKQSSDKSWMTWEIKKHMRKKQSAFNKAKRLKKERDWRRFQQLKSKTRELIVEAKLREEANQTEAINRCTPSDGKLWWRQVS